MFIHMRAEKIAALVPIEITICDLKLLFESASIQLENLAEIA